MRDFESNSDERVSGGYLPGDEAGIETPDTDRHTYPRDQCWLDWYEDCHSETYHCPAAIRDKWNGFPNRKRRAIAPKAWQRLRGDVSGRRSVEQALSLAKFERVI